MAKRVIVTGGSGKVGKYVIDALLNEGHEVLNLDLVPYPASDDRPVHTLKVDLCDGAQVYSGMMSHFRLAEPFVSSVPLGTPPDAVIHLAGYARNMIAPDTETFRLNTQSAYNIIEASCRLGVKKVVLASTGCVYGVTYADGDVDFPSFPVDEEVDCDPMDVYALSKVCVERLARGFGRRFGIDIYALRIGAVIAPDEYRSAFPRYVNEPHLAKAHLWSYTDARDLGQICLCCLARDGLGFQVFNATNDEITNTHPTTELLKRLCPNTPFTRVMGGREAPMSNRKAREMLGFRQEHPWQSYYPASG